MFSVVICTHNPDSVKFNRALRAIEQQTLPVDEWEWIVIDNASSIPVSTLIPNELKNRITVLEEKEPGLTPARICAINAAKHEWIVFVDDDNVLRADFLFAAKK